jgi:hypothetical protein
MKTALLALALLTVADDQAKKDLKPLVGTWEYVSQVDDGKETGKDMLTSCARTRSRPRIMGYENPTL